MPWCIIHTYVPPSTTSGFTRIQFADSIIGFASTNYYDFFKTTNSGVNWLAYQTPWGADDMSVLNKDTVFVVSYLDLGGGVYRSTNGGVNWTRIWTGGTVNPIMIYMVNKDLGFIRFSSYPMQRTTNGGFNWTLILGETYTSIAFLDSNIGWKVFDSIKKTTNGGINWIAQNTPIYSSQFENYTSFSILNKDTVWFAGASKFYKPPIYKTTNGGLNWGYQIPDTNLQVYNYSNIQFVNSKNGWTNPRILKLYHTTTGGNDSTIYTGVNSINSQIIFDYQLFQNYPNPFNNISNLKFKIAKICDVKISVYDIQGKEVETLVNKTMQAGTYHLQWDGERYSSGIYFYSMILDGRIADTKRMIMIK